MTDAHMQITAAAVAEAIAVERKRHQTERDAMVKALNEIAELYSGGHGYRAKEIALGALAGVGSLGEPQP